MNETVWIVAQIMYLTDKGLVWEVGGIFDEEEDAVSACIDETYLVAPLPKNTVVDYHGMPWPGCYYPLVD